MPKSICPSTIALRLFTAESTEFSFWIQEHRCDEGSERYGDSQGLNWKQEVVDGTYQEWPRESLK
jgi:hypothetical protein